ncbi:hypothetical protein FRB98_007331 [Tulasnella sp. 332]|nr:hypothetical protein FRB98_007331 [Tulasnella sp. 332]
MRFNISTLSEINLRLLCSRPATTSVDQIPVADENLAIVNHAVTDLNLRPEAPIPEHRHLGNQTAPIDQLPNELLTRVFFFTLIGWQMDSLRKSRQLVQVCSKWLQLVKGTPSLFGDVSTYDTPKNAFQQLRLSQDGPLDITYRENIMTGPWKWGGLLEALIPQSHRWRSVRLMDIPSSLVHRVLSRPTPQLRNIEILRPEYDGAISLNPSTLGQLRYLTLECVTLQWDPLGLRGLKELELKGIGIEGRPSLSQLLGVLSASKELQILRLALESVTRDPIAEESPIELSQLTELSLVNLQTDTTHDLLAHLVVPGCNWLTIRTSHATTIENSPSTVFDDATRHMDTLLQSILASTSHIDIDLFGAGMFIKGTMGTKGRTNLDLDLPPLPLSGSMGWFEPFLRKVSMPITIALTYSDPLGVERIFPLLHHSSITTLKLFYGTSEAARWIEDLSTPISIDGVLTFPLSGLKNLDFYKSALNPNDLVGMIRKRYGRDSGTKVKRQVPNGSVEEDGKSTGDHATEVKESEKRHGEPRYGHVQHSQPLRLPAPLDSLDIYDCDGITVGVYEELMDIIGRGNVRWAESEDEGVCTAFSVTD